MASDKNLTYERERYKLVASISEARSYYLFTPDHRELVFKTSWKQNLNFIICPEANHAENVVANQLYKTNQIIN